MGKILIIDDNESLRYTLTNVLEESGFDTNAVEDGYRALQEIKSNMYDLVICDMKLPEMDGIQILQEIKKLKPNIPFIMLTAFGEIKNAVEAMKHGAQDYITKPFNNDAMIMTIRKALEMKYLSQEVDLLRKRMDETYKSGDVIGNSELMNELFEQVKIVAPTNLTVLIQGESGTGKEVIANMIHKMSSRKNNSMIAVDCGAIPESLIESELFGHEKGAFTDARTQKEGKFELANESTIFLDEITNLSDSNQVKLLRIIQERKVTRLGGKKPITLDVRIVAATNSKLAEAVNNKKFRADLYYRLNEFHLDVPSLRERKEDIPLFIDHFIKDANKELNKNVNGLSEDMWKKILSHGWTGNVRELRNVIRRAVLLCPGDTITSISILNEIDNPTVKLNEDSLSIDASTRQLEKELILKAIEDAGGNKSKAAKILNINERTFYRKIKNLGI